MITKLLIANLVLIQMRFSLVYNLSMTPINNENNKLCQIKLEWKEENSTKNHYYRMHYKFSDHPSSELCPGKAMIFVNGSPLKEKGYQIYLSQYPDLTLKADYLFYANSDPNSPDFEKVNNKYVIKLTTKKEEQRAKKLKV